MTQEPTNGNVCLLPMNNKICQQGRKVHSPGRVGWIAAALIALVAFFGSVPANASIGASLVTSITDLNDAASYGFPSAAYSNNVLYICFTHTSTGTAPAPSVTGVSGAGLTFSEIGTAGGQLYGSSAGLRRVQAWRALVTSGATTGVVTITVGGTSTSMGAVMLAFTGTKTSGTNGADAVVQSAGATSAGTSVNQLTVDLVAFADSNNRPVACFGHRINETSTPESGYTELFDGGHGTPAMGYEAEWHPTAVDTTPTGFWATAERAGGFALEIAVAPLVPLYRSVGTNTGNLNTDSRTVTISGTTATFSGSMPNNIGVGDVLQYQVSSTYYVAFIHGRTSANVYTVKSASGGNPQAAAAGTSVNVYRAYTSLYNWEAQDENDTLNDAVENFDTTTNLVSANTIMNVACYGDGADTTPVTINGWTTGVYNYIKIYTPVSSSEVGATQRHNGKWDDSKYRIETAGTGSTCPINVTGAGDVWIDGLQIFLNPPGGNGNGGILVNQSGTVTNHKISNNIVRSVTNPTYDYNGIYMYAAAGGSTARIWNNIVYDFAGTTGRGIAFSSSNITSGYVYNNTVYNCRYGYYRSAGTVIVKNNIYRSNGISGADGYNGTFDPSSDYNSSDISGDAPVVSPRVNTVSPWYSGATTDANIFIAPAATPRDLHLLSSTIFLNVGVDLSSDTNLAFSDDIDGETRSGTWDIGADEASPVPLYRSVGTNGNNLNLGGPTVTISGTTATFNGSMPNNVGVGDALTYNSGGNRLAFIHGRTSPMVFTVRDKIGGTPTAASAGTTVGVYRAYTSLANWQSQTENGNIVEPAENDVNPSMNLVSANTILNVACYADGQDSTAVTIDGWTTGANNYINIFTPYLSSEVAASQRHNGKWDTTKYRLVASAVSIGVIRINDEYVRVTGLQIENTAIKTSGNNIGLENVAGSATSEVRLSHNILRPTGTGLADWRDAAIYQGNSGGVLKAWNNIMYDWGSGISSEWIPGGSVILYNNTVVDSEVYGIFLQGDPVGNYRVANNLVQRSNTADYDFTTLNGGLDYSATNLSQDATSPETSLRNKTVSFVDAAGKDFHLVSSDTNAKDQGTNLSSDPNLAFSDDIEGQSRPYGSAWDIGADENEFRPPTSLYRSVGTNAGNLNNSGPTVTISGTTATFSGSMPNNVGVGDVLTYTSGGAQLAFIHGRTSSTVFTVLDKNGGTPAAATALTVVGVYRAYTSLANWQSQTENGNITEPVENDVNPSKSLTSANTIMNVACYADGVDTASVLIDGWITGANNYIKIYTPYLSSEVGASQRHNGKWDDGKYRLVANVTFASGVIHVQDEYVRISGLQIENTGNKADQAKGIRVAPGSAVSEIRISHTIFRATGTGTAEVATAAIYQSNTSGLVKAWNNIMYDWGSGYYMVYMTAGQCTTYPECGVTLYNNTIVNGVQRGISVSGVAAGNYRLANNLVQGASTGANYFLDMDDFIIDYSATNLSLDATKGCGSCPTAELTNKTVSFVDAANKDFRLSYADDSAQNYGTDLSSDPNLAFSDDIEGQSRPFGSAWDIGADENAEAPYYRRVITLNVAQRGSSCTGSLSNFPVLIDTTNWPAADKSTLKTVSNGGHVNRPEGYDIIFRASDGVTQLDHEIEKYEGSTGTLVAWVRIPTLFENNQDTAIYLDYGNTLITSSTANPAGVWNTSYGWQGVWHLADTSGDTRDSTSYNTNGVVSGMTRGASGQIDGAFNSDTNDYVNMGDPADGHLDFGTGGFTVSAWLNIDAPVGTGAWPQVIWKGNASWGTGYVLEYDDDTNNFYFVIEDGNPQYGCPSPAASFSEDTWTYIVGVVDRTNTRIRIYKNGVEQGTGGDISLCAGSVSNADNFTIGIVGGTGNPDGLIDEVRISNIARDACWIGTEYNNQNGPGSFTTVGSEIMLGQFENRKQITLNVSQRGSSCTGSLSNFPVLINLSGDWLKTKANGGSIYHSNGYDIIFRDANNNHLDHEIEKYDGSATPGNLIAWVRIPTLFENNQDTVIQMYYGNASISSPTENPAGVWDTNYRGVWHLKESGNGSQDEYKDSSQYANHGQGGKGYPLYVPTRVAGKVSYGQDFNNSDGKYNLIDLGNDPSLDVIGKQITLEAWVQHNGTFERQYGILNHKGWSNGYSLWMQGDHYQCPSGVRCVQFNLPGATDSIRTQTTLTGSTWHHVVGTYDGASMKVFIDGVQDSNTEPKTDDITAPPLPENDVWIGYGDQGMDVAWSAEWEGQIDEVRISSVARDTCWIQTQYNNQNSPSAFSTIGTGEEFEYKYRKQITILDSMTPAGCSTDITNFPVLINLSGTWLKTVANGGNISHPYGYDIIFKAQDGETKLDHEIEKYDGSATGGTLVAWVRIPTLRYNASTIIYMYYGNPEVTSLTANKTGVWDSNYAAVWHLKETTGGSGAIKNSTSYSNDGTNSAGLSLGAAGKMDGAIYFDGAGDYVTVPSPTNVSPPVYFTVSAWIKVNSADDGEIVSRGDSWALRLYAGGDVNFHIYRSGAWDNKNPSGNEITNFNEFHYIACGVNETGSFYSIDGVNLQQQADKGTIDYSLGPTVEIGRHGNGGGAGYDFSGIIDEVRISTVGRSNCWIGTEYNNLSSSSPGTYYTVEGEQELTFNHRKQITLLNSMTPASCSSNLSNFPVHISLSGNWLKTVANGGDISSANGYDIIFRAQDGVTKLDHEIEKYDGTPTAGTLVAWIRIPTLLYNANTIIYMYYGNSTVTTSQANPTGVWDTNYKGVWHLNPSLADSTVNGNNGTNNNTSDVVGKLANGRNFVDTSSQYITTPSTDLKTADSFTVSAWFKAGSTAYAHHMLWEGIAAGGNGWGETASYVQEMNLSLGNYLDPTGYSDYLSFFLGDRDVGAAPGGAIQISTPFTDTTNWHHVVAAVSNLSTSPSGTLYLDGASVGTTTGTTARTGRTTWDTSFQMGKPGTATRYYAGNLDEVRIETVARDACWIGTEYTNQSSPLASYTVEGEEFDYKYRKQITIKDSMTPDASCSSDLTNFPVLISLSGNWLKTKAADPVNGCIENASGYDIVFKAEDGETKLDHEIEKYDGTAGTLVAWVRIPTLLRNANTIIYMYYGNPTVTSPTANPNGVWDSNSKAVYHLKETSGNQNDSTSNANHLTTVAVTNQGSATGKMDGADQFNGSGNYAQTNSTSAFDVAASNSMTVEAWINTSSSSGFVVNRKDTDGIPGWQLYVTGSGTIEFRFVDNSNNTALATSSGTVNNGQFHYVVGRWDGGSKTAEIFVDNLSPVSATNAAVGANTVTRFLAIGREGDDTPAYYFNGIIDEVRFSSTARSNCWIGTEYNNQNSPLAHIDVEGAENLDYSYRQLITISDSMTPASCSSDLTNFPVLISLSGNWLKTVGNGGNISSANGYDIIFRDENGLAKLDHEIEDYNGSAGTLLAWVRIPTLHFNDNTNIYIYYGNPAITSPTANPAGVWVSNYKSVYHLKENPATSTIIYDSTSSAYNLDNASYLGLQMTGQVDGAVYFANPAHRWFGTASANNITTEDVTISAWIKTNETSVSRGLLGKPKVGSQPYGGYGFGTQVSGGNSYLDFRWHADSYYDRSVTATTNPLNDNAWHYVVATAIRSASGPTKLYVDGNLVIADTQSNLDTWDSSGNLFHMGDANWGYTGFWYDHGMDEVRIATATRSECWIQTEYNNMKSPATYVTLGSEAVFAPTVVKLSSFKATRYPEGTLLEWKTGYEVDNLGFHIYREENGQRVRLTPEPVAGSAFLAGKGTSLTAGHSYFWWDVSSLSAISHQPSAIKYWLKDIDLNGKQTMHGPVTPVFSKEPLPNKFRPELLSEVGLRLQERYHHYWKVQDLRERLRLRNRGRHKLFVKTNNDSRITYNKRTSRSSRPKADLLFQQYLVSRPAVKLFVREEGWYQVSQPELVAAGLSSRVDPRYLQLFAEGREQPIHVIGGKDGRFGPRDAIEFYGVGLDTPSTDTRVYWLVESSKPGKRIHEFKGYSGSLGSLSSSSFPYTVEKKDRWVYLPAIKNGEEENFFGPIIYTKPVDQVLEVRHLDRGSSEDALLEVALQGATSGTHRVKVYLNDEKEEVGEIVFEGQTRGLVSLPISQSELEEGENLVSLEAQGGEMDVSLVDSIRLTYWHTYTADDNGLRLRARGGSGVSIDGFSDSNIRVFDITDSNEVIEVIGRVESQKGSYAVSFRVPGHGERTLLALSEGRVKNPIEIVSDHPSAWHQEKGGYGLLIISHRDFFSSLQPLIKLRESQGYKVALIDVEDLYDEFSFGHKSPHALRDFLSLAKKQWSKPPRFVLLVGDASFDPRNYLGSGELDFLPTKLIDTAYLETASDDWFVDLNNDGLPEMAIGRLPVQTAKEAAIVVSKIVGYEKSGKKREAILVSDINDGFNFEGASEEIGGLLPSSLRVRKIYRGQFSSDDQVRRVLLDSIGEGPLLVNFIGHGSIEIWRGIFTSEDAENLLNKGLPFFVNMTCLNGYFQDPYSETLAESLLKAQSGGAVAIWTSSGLTEPDQQAVMNKELIKLLFGRGSLTLGEATVRAKASVSDQDIRKTWILFGDPTTRLRH